MTSANLRSVANWNVPGLLAVLAAVTIGISQSVSPVQAQGPQVRPPANPCQSIIDGAVRQAQNRRPIDFEKFQKDLKDCAAKNSIPFVESDAGKKDGQPSSERQLGTNLPGGVWPCLNAPLPSGFLFWIVLGAGTFTQPQYAGNSWNVASVQYESTRPSTLYSFAPGFGSAAGTGVVRSVVAPFTPPAPPVDLVILYVTWGASPGPAAPFFSSPVYAVCMGMDRS